MTDTLHPCVLPRRRFVRVVVVLCLLVVLGLFGCSRCFVPEYFAVFMVEAVMLFLPSRTKGGTLVQLLGLLMPAVRWRFSCSVVWRKWECASRGGCITW